MPEQDKIVAGWTRYIWPMIAAAVTSIIGGSAGAWVTLQLHELRIGQLEQHAREDKVQFSIIDARDALVSAELAAIRERHRLEDLTRAGESRNGTGH